MKRHNEISTTFFPEFIADNTLFALEYSGGLYYRKRGQPVSIAERERCIAAIIMLFVSFEGYFNRIIYQLCNYSQRSDQYLNLQNVASPATRLEGILDKSQISIQLVERFKEGLVLRNAIAHGHLYETGRNIHRQISKINKVILDDKNNSYRKFVNENTLRTKNLRLHVVPSEIGISDLYQILKLWNDIYRRLNKIHPGASYLQNYIFPDYSDHLRAEGRLAELSALEDKLLGREDGGFTELLSLFDINNRSK